ncbi:MAG: DnaJ domain-containing protein [Sideroxyarcus sp.]|nr:DnaJ domain-containing protein [Sideroxyarcus sp.]
MNCYEILEVSQNASPEVIKAAYKSLMQRYHPDKNPGNSEIEAHASMVIQAYELLSDSNKRAAYDIKLKQELVQGFQPGQAGVQVSTIANGRQVFEARKSYWLLWLLITLTIVLCLYTLSLLKNSPVDEIPGANREMATQNSDRSQEALPRTIPVLISNLTVGLNDPEGYSGSSARVLDIPILGVKVGTVNANMVLRFLNGNKELIRQKLEENLAAANYEELIKINGEQYLKNLILNSIGDTTGTKKYTDDPLAGAGAVGQYGVVDILLPRSFSVH